MQVTCEPVAEFAALAALQELLAIAAIGGATALPSNTPISSPAAKARNPNRGNDDATPRETSSATRPVWRAGADDRRLASPNLASTAGRDHGINVELLLGHGSIEHRPFRTEAADDV
jgi:hypothetical protein